MSINRTNKNDYKNKEECFDTNYVWGEIQPTKLSAEIDVKRLREPRSMLVDEPLFSNVVSSDTQKFDEKKPPTKNHEFTPGTKRTNVNFKKLVTPSIT